MNAILCDICGRQLAEENNYLIPSYQFYNIQHGKHIIKEKAFKKIKRKVIDLCPVCESMVASIFQNIDINKK